MPFEIQDLAPSGLLVWLSCAFSTRSVNPFVFVVLLFLGGRLQALTCSQLASCQARVVMLSIYFVSADTLLLRI